MFNKFTFLHNKDTKLFFVSDTHFFHAKPFIYEPRGFENIYYHNKELIKRWNDKVGPNDHVIHLGDFIVGAGGGSQVLDKGNEILFSLNGHINLTWGNHNAFVKDIYREAVKNTLGFCDDTTEFYPVTYKDKITFYGNNLLVRVKFDGGSQYIFCSHFAHRIWIDSHKGDVWHLSGHSHGGDKESNPDFKNCKRLDVGIDNFGGPISYDEVKKVMLSKNNIAIDEHH
jgi:calcineurin-like phosphoesterase family protein